MCAVLFWLLWFTPVCVQCEKRGYNINWGIFFFHNKVFFRNPSVMTSLVVLVAVVDLWVCSHTLNARERKKNLTINSKWRRLVNLSRKEHRTPTPSKLCFLRFYIYSHDWELLKSFTADSWESAPDLSVPLLLRQMIKSCCCCCWCCLLFKLNVDIDVGSVCKLDVSLLSPGYLRKWTSK